MDWEDDEELQQEDFVYQPHPTLPLVFKDQQKYQCSTLFVALYGPASLFAHSLITNPKPINRINFSRAKQQSLADLYQGNTNDLYLIFNDIPEPMKEIYFAQFLQQHFGFDRAIIFTAASRNNLREAATPKLTFVSTSFVLQNLNLPRFSEGVMGLSADLIQWGEINKKSVNCLIGTLGEYELSSEIVQDVFGILRGKQGMTGHVDIAESVRRYNMRKYSNKIYL